jgi:hypothetical protein
MSLLLSSQQFVGGFVKIWYRAIYGMVASEMVRPSGLVVLERILLASCWFREGIFLDDVE